MESDPILQQLQPSFDEFLSRLKDEKRLQGKTNQDIADATGIPLSSVGKFFSGNLSNPSALYLIAACLYLRVPIDRSLGLAPPEQTGADQDHALADLENENRELLIHLDYLRQDRARLESALRSRKMIITALFGVCVLLICIFSFGILYDYLLHDKGYLQDGSIGLISVICITSIVLAIASTIVIFCLCLNKKPERSDKHESA